ncbi:hypothetical protein V1505DRAFT_362282 [Lipomyces doorenjongii]
MRMYIPLTQRVELPSSTLHGVLHLAECIKNCGPTWVYWQFTIKITCGNLVSSMKGKSRLDEDLANNILLNEKMNMLRWANPSMALTWEEEIYGSNGDIVVGSLKCALNSTL